MSKKKLYLLIGLLFLFFMISKNGSAQELPFGNAKPFERVLINVTINSANRYEFNRLFMSEFYDNLIYSEEKLGQVSYKFAIFANTGVIKRFLLRSSYFFRESFAELDSSKDFSPRYYAIVPPKLNSSGVSLQNLEPLELKSYFDSAFDVLTRSSAIPALTKFTNLTMGGLNVEIPSYALTDLGHLSNHKRNQLLRNFKRAGIRVIKQDLARTSVRCFSYFN